MRVPGLLTGLRSVLLVLLAPVAAVCATAVHLTAASLGPVTLPWGLGLALIGCAATMHLARQLASTRWWVVGAALGWIAPILVLSTSSGAGDLVIIQDWPSLTFVFGSVLVVGVALGRSPGRRPQAVAARSPQRQEPGVSDPLG